VSWIQLMLVVWLFRITCVLHPLYFFCWRRRGVAEWLCVFFWGYFFSKVKLGLTYVCCVMSANVHDLGPLLTWVDAAFCQETALCRI
jgi:hypothetical protein